MKLDDHDIQAVVQKVVDEMEWKMRINPLPNRTDDTLLNVKELAKYLSVEPSWVYKKVQQGLLPYFKVGKYLRFQKSEIDKVVELSRRTPSLHLKGGG
jgi:excisionase family DNA binding protein